MTEAMEEFKNICGATNLHGSRITLCFTKMDIFNKKVASGMSPIITCFPEYGGMPTDVAAARTYITGKFKDIYIRNQSVSGPSMLKILYLDATKTEDVRKAVAEAFKR